MKHLKVFEEYEPNYSEEDLAAIEHGKRMEAEWASEEEPEQPEEEFPQEEASREPDPDDFIISSDGWKYSVGSEDHGFLGEFVEWDDAVKALKEWSKKHKWYPNVWTMSDHGNLSDEPFAIEDL